MKTDRQILADQAVNFMDLTNKGKSLEEKGLFGAGKFKRKFGDIFFIIKEQKKKLLKFYKNSEWHIVRKMQKLY